MKYINPDLVSKSRVYFTEFDRVTYSQVAWTTEDVENIKLSLERKLKLLALIKGHVVIAASHLIESELAHEIFLLHPRLFSDGLIIPALRSEFASFKEFAESKIAEGKEADLYRGGSRLEMIQMIDETARWVIPWNVKTTSSYFKQRLIQDLEDRQSIIRLATPKDFLGWLKIIEEVQKAPILSRGEVYRIARASGHKQLWEILCIWANFVYYLSGAVAVRSEGVLPQENLLDFSLSDLAGGRTRLSEIQVFFKIFVDLVKQATQTHFPTDILDALSIEDALDLHEIAISSSFIDKYNLIMERTKEGLIIHDAERLVLLMEELAQFETELYYEYKEAIRRELPIYSRKIRQRDAHQILSSTASLLVPYYDIPKNTSEIVVSGLRLVGKKEWSESLEKSVKGSLRAIDQMLDRRQMGDRSILLDFMEIIKEKYAKKLLE